MKEALLKLLTMEVPVFIFGGVFLVLMTMVTMMTLSTKAAHKQRDRAVVTAAKWELAHKESEIRNASLHELLSLQEESIDQVTAMCRQIVTDEREHAHRAIKETDSIKRELGALRDSLDNKPGGLRWQDLRP